MRLLTLIAFSMALSKSFGAKDALKELPWMLSAEEEEEIEVPTKEDYQIDYGNGNDYVDLVLANLNAIMPK